MTRRAYTVRALTPVEQRMLDTRTDLGPRHQPRLVIDQQSFDLDNDGCVWEPGRAEWYRAMLAIALARLVEREVAQATASLSTTGGPERCLAAEILAELQRARAKFPGKNVTFAALVEEVGELATAMFEESADRVRREAVQVAVMAIRIVLDGDHLYDDWRAGKGLDPLDPAERGCG